LIKFFPSLVGRLPRLSKALGGYEKAVPVNKGKPIPAWVVGLLIAHALRQKTAETDVFAVMCWLLFDSYARINEITRLTAGKLQYVGEKATKQTRVRAVIGLPKTKRGHAQSVTIDDEQLVEILLHFKRSAPSPQHRLFGMTYQRFKHLLHKFLQVFNLDNLGYLPHSFRHGGATQARLNGVHIEDIKIRGRWDSKSFKVYLSECEVVGINQETQLASQIDAKTMDSGINYFNAKYSLCKTRLACVQRSK
jgi:hypothetical protein